MEAGHMELCIQRMLTGACGSYRKSLCTLEVYSWAGTKKYCATIFLAESWDSQEGSKICNFLPGWSKDLRQVSICYVPSGFGCPQPMEQRLLDKSPASRNVKVPGGYLQPREGKKTPFPHCFRGEKLAITQQ